MKWDELPRVSDAERNANIEGMKMTTKKWLVTMFALAYVALFMHGTRQLVAAAIIVAVVLISVAVEHWAKPTPGAD
jgi:uncharacterized membrane protein